MMRLAMVSAVLTGAVVFALGASPAKGSASSCVTKTATFQYQDKFTGNYGGPVITNYFYITMKASGCYGGGTSWGTSDPTWTWTTSTGPNKAPYPIIDGHGPYYHSVYSTPPNLSYTIFSRTPVFMEIRVAPSGAGVDQLAWVAPIMQLYSNGTWRLWDAGAKLTNDCLPNINCGAAPGPYSPIFIKAY